MYRSETSDDDEQSHVVRNWSVPPGVVSTVSTSIFSFLLDKEERERERERGRERENEKERALWHSFRRFPMIQFSASGPSKSTKSVWRTNRFLWIPEDSETDKKNLSSTIRRWNSFYCYRKLRYPIKRSWIIL